MAKIVHARMRPEGLRFRLWSTIADGYCCEPMEREPFAEWMRTQADTEAVRDISECMVRAEAVGSSALWPGSEPDSKSDWDTERCHECGGFHHAFRPDASGSCSNCGEPKRDRAHRKACK